MNLPSSDRKRLYLVLGGLIAVIAAVTAAWRFTPLRDLVTPESVIDWVETFARFWWAPYALILLYSVASLVLFPRALITVAAAVAFGPLKGFFIAMAGVALNALLGYFAGRQLDPDLVRRWGGPRMEKVGKALGKEGLLAVTTVGLLPIAPFLVLVVAFGALRIKLWHVLGGVLLAHLPGTIGSTLLGDQVHAILSHDRTLNPFVVGGVVVAMALVALTTHRLWKRVQSSVATA